MTYENEWPAIVKPNVFMNQDPHATELFSAQNSEFMLVLLEC